MLIKKLSDMLDLDLQIMFLRLGSEADLLDLNDRLAFLGDLNLQTGGAAVGDTSTRSRPALAASARASVRVMTPNCSPSILITRTEAALISRLILKSLAIGHLQTLKNYLNWAHCSRTRAMNASTPMEPRFCPSRCRGDT
jgi:hypothetical protein